MKTTSAGITDVGCVRLSNEDSLGLFPEFNLYVVADGMGGHAAGEIASNMATAEMKAFFTNQQGSAHNMNDASTKPSREALMSQAISSANQSIYKAASQDSSCKGMGTTIVALLADPTELIIGFVGDSRVYLQNKGRIEQLTQDHSLVNHYVQQGLLSPEAAETHPLKHVLSRALGTNAEVKVETLRRVPEPGDLFILCSDGLSNKLTPQDIHTILTEAADDLKKGGMALVERAKKNGGEDNITAILLRYA
ncbi:MAG: Stp1/IreP family PP2C-type Ser/Thr phosphatase [Nitrospira sp.]|nr:Stp1/IreP family PP2C-type Ser/Thr phosphatase [Candidatus Manganitrophaceae bacterium]HIL35315.1 Stp1/IreP family PP2C-type Ser/Thr phosphatase [Candidatus Manganitrophaceae bacterium]